MHYQGSNRRAASQAGFTMTEVMITASVFLVVLYGVYLVYSTGEANYSSSSRKWDAQSQARVALERMGREIRTAGYNSPTKVTDPVVIATDDTLTIHADVGDGNGLRYITYSRRDCSGNIGATIFRNTSTSTYCGGDPFVDGVTSLTFTYYELVNVSLPYPLTSTYQLDDQGPVTGTTVPSTPASGGQRDRVRQIKVTLTVQQQISGKVFPFTVTTDVALRNLLP